MSDLIAKNDEKVADKIATIKHSKLHLWDEADSLCASIGGYYGNDRHYNDICKNPPLNHLYSSIFNFINENLQGIRISLQGHCQQKYPHLINWEL